jgi:hypothetical protein
MRCNAGWIERQNENGTKKLIKRRIYNSKSSSHAAQYIVIKTMEIGKYRLQTDGCPAGKAAAAGRAGRPREQSWSINRLMNGRKVRTITWPAPAGF